MLGPVNSVSVGCSEGGILPPDHMSKACFQNAEMLLKVESSASSILNMLTVSTTSLKSELLHTSESVLPSSQCQY